MSEKLPIEFYGGEPLLYFDEIKEIILELQDSCSFSIISNGKGITEDQVYFFNQHHVSYRLSWDGKKTKKLRGYDVLKDKQYRDNLLKLNDFGISSVLSEENMPLDLFYAYLPIAITYWMLHGKSPGLNTDELMDMHGTITSTKKGCLEIRRQVNKILDIYQIKEYDSIVEEILIERWVDDLKQIAEDKGWNPRMAYNACGNGYDTVNLDIKGNLYGCHNLSSPAATIYDPYFFYLGRIIESDRTLLYKDSCRKCNVFRYCGGGCKLMDRKTREKSYCNLKRAVFEPFIERFG